MKNRIWILISLVMVIAACAKVPITGRKQLKLLPASTLNQMAKEEYQKFLAAHTLCSDAAKVEQVKRVGERIERAATHYFTAKKQAKYLAGYRWVINVVEEATVNAWCMPGGKVVVYTGLLPVTMNDDALAVVMGHEIAHALANHGNERMSQGLAEQAGGMALSVALSNQSPATQDLFLKAYGVGANLGAMLPFSRLHETEADEIGLCLMAMAGYNPEEAIPFWQRMEKASGGGAPPAWLSTHPSNSSRIQNLKKVMPKAKLYATKYGNK
jgi:predicted Zn-dependent protease